MQENRGGGVLSEGEAAGTGREESCKGKALPTPVEKEKLGLGVGLGGHEQHLVWMWHIAVTLGLPPFLIKE